MAKKREADSSTEEETTQELERASGEKVPTETVSKTEVTVKFLDFAGNPTERTFSREVHGDKFAELTEEFKVTNASKLIKE